MFTPTDSTLSLIQEKLIEEKDLSLFGIRACLYAALSDYFANTKLVESTPETELILQITQYVNDHSAEPITLDSTAKSIGYSANYLSHCIKRSCGLSFPSLLAYIRTENAKSLLSDTDMSVLDIALESGFGSERSFHRHFKTITGITPRQYRNDAKLTVLDRAKEKKEEND